MISFNRLLTGWHDDGRGFNHFLSIIDITGKFCTGASLKCTKEATPLNPGYLCCRRDPAHIDVLTPFLQYLYCQPQRQTQHALLRHSLLKVLLPSPPRTRSALQDKDQEQNCSVSDGLLIRLCQMVPYMQVTCGYLLRLCQ